MKLKDLRLSRSQKRWADACMQSYKRVIVWKKEGHKAKLMHPGEIFIVTE